MSYSVATNQFFSIDRDSEYNWLVEVGFDNINQRVDTQVSNTNTFKYAEQDYLTAIYDASTLSTQKQKAYGSLMEQIVFGASDGSKDDEVA